MRALISTFGTRGDIEPYLALAHRLVQQGHRAVLNCPEAYRADAEHLGVGFEPMGSEMHDLLRAGMAQLDGTAVSPKLIRSMTAAMERSLAEQWDAAERTDPTLLIAHPKALGGFHVAQRRRIRFVASIPLPFLTPTAAFPVPFLSRPLPGRLNRMSYGFNRFTAVAYGGMINRFRRRLGLRPMGRFDDYLHHPDDSDVPVLYGFSRHVVPVPADYPSTAHVTGYWFRPTESDWTPPAGLAAFLDRDESVVFIGFGSMGFGKGADRRGALVAEAIAASGVAAVVARGWGGLELGSTDRVHVLDEAPYEWLFPRVAAVVHHGGAGTTAAGLRAGRPTLVCPLLGDQGFWGRRVHELGAGPEPVRLSRATVDGLAGRIRSLVDDPGYQAGAGEIGERIRAEDGAAAAVAVLERLHGTPPVW